MRGRAGIDLNGWRDRAMRNWTVTADGERQDTPSLIDGGLFGAVVDTRGQWVGGAQAALAPHGRSPGWGDVGAAERRVDIRDLLATAASDNAPLVAAMAALSQGADHVALAIDDVPRSDDLLQERLIAALRKAGAYRNLLVWRPVLVALWAIAEDLVAADRTLGVICHDRDGLCVQTLRIRRESGRVRDILAPERRSAGVLHPGPFGYAALARAARDTVEESIAPRMRLDRLETTRTVARLALGMPAATEMLRVANGDWFQLVPPDAPAQPPVDLPAALRDGLAGCDVVLFESLTSGPVRVSLHSDLEAALGRGIVAAADAAVAVGALNATDRQASREPVYFDFLPQISTIVLDAATGQARSHDLIESEATLPAGTVYRSQRPAQFGMPGGSQPIKVHLRKETEPKPRRATVDFGTDAISGTLVELSVEQAPLSGRARILLALPSLSRQQMVDWDAAESLDEDWQAIVDRMSAPPPTIPDRLVLPCGMAGWEDSARGPGLLTLLERNAERIDVDRKALASRLSQRPGGIFCISSDGAVPEEVPERARAQLDRLTQSALAEELSRLAHRRAEDNDRIQFLTWQFRRCPPELVEALLPAVVDDEAWARAFPHWSHRKLVFQGLGRAVSDPETERKLLDAILARPVSSWNWWGEIACLSFLLSRSQTAPHALTATEAARIGKASLQDFQRCLGTAYTTFFYTPFLLAGLLRWRLVNPRAFLIDSDPLAQSLDDVVAQSLPSIRRAARKRPGLLRYLPILDNIREELRGTGSNPELLMDIFRQDTDSQDGDDSRRTDV